MEKVIIKCPYCEHLQQVELLQKTGVSKVTDANEALVRDFLLNNAPALTKLQLDKSFVCSIMDNGNIIILGAFVFTDKDVRTKIQINWEDEITRNYHELSHLVLEERLLDYNFLIRSFRKVLPLLVKEDDSQEIFWMENKGQLYSRVTDVVAKQYPTYFYQNEAEYFSQSILQIIETDSIHKQEFFERLKNAPQ